VVGTVLFLVMTTWIKGRALVSELMDERKVLFEDLEDKVNVQTNRVPGTAIYLTRSLHGVPLVLLQNLSHNHVMHQRMIVLSIVTTNEPFVDESHRLKIRTFGENKGFYRVKLYYGLKKVQTCAEL